MTPLLLALALPPRPEPPAPPEPVEGECAKEYAIEPDGEQCGAACIPPSTLQRYELHVDYATHLEAHVRALELELQAAVLERDAARSERDRWREEALRPTPFGERPVVGMLVGVGVCIGSGVAMGQAGR